MYIDRIKTFLKKLNPQGVVFVYILLMMLVPIVPRLTSTFLSTYFYMIVVVTAVLFTFISCRVKLVKDFILLLLPFILYQLLELLYNRSEEFLLAGYRVLLFMLPVCLGYYLVTHVFFTELYSILLMAIVSITCVTTIIGCIKNPDAARILATTADSQDVYAILYEFQNIGGYGFVYSSVLMYPFVILAFKTKKLHIVFVILFTVLLFYMTIQAEYTFALVFMMLSSLLHFVKKDIPIKKFLILMLVLVLVVLVFRVAIAAILTDIGNMIGNQKMVDKINAAILGKDSVENMDDNRDELYMMSIRRFLQHPLFGSLIGKRYNTGGHSFILDTLAQYGLIGGALLFFMYRGIYFLIIKPLEGKVGYYIVFWTFLQTIILSTINTGMWLNNLCVYSPILLCAIYGKETYIGIEKPRPTPQIPVKSLC